MIFLSTYHKFRLGNRLCKDWILFSFCVQTGEALNIDPRGFYSMLYLSLLQVHAGKSSGLELIGLCVFV